MDLSLLTDSLIECSEKLGVKIRKAVNKMPHSQRGEQVDSVLKRGTYSRRVDVEAERIGIRALRRFSREYGVRIDLVLDEGNNGVYTIGEKTHPRIYCFFDPVDGTGKVAGIGNDPKNGIYRTAGDGSWGTGIAFTMPTRKRLEGLFIGDFKIAVIVDGNPAMYRTYPQIVCATRRSAKELETKERREGRELDLATSSQKELSKALMVFEPFQAYDRRTAPRNIEGMPEKIYATLVNRNNGGAFNLLGFHCTYAGIQRLLLGWRDQGIEAQGTAYLSINENLPNMVPVVPIIEEAGGLAIDFQGNPLRERRIIDGRTDVIYAANKHIAKKILKKIKQAGNSRRKPKGLNTHA